MRICIVDDNIFVRDSLALLLRGVGHEVVLAEDGPEALKLAENATFDVIIADYDLPGMKGDALAIVLRAQCPGLTIILSSGRPLPLDLAEGALDLFLPKPYTLRTLLNALEQAPRQRRASA